MSQPDLIYIKLSALTISKLNMRHGRRAPDVSDILPSIREKGIRQTLLVRREGERYGVIAGRRRFFALQQVAKETGTDPLVPCAVMTESDAAAAIEASIIENVARLPATEMEQFTAFRKLHDEGRTVEEIAVTFGVTELSVRRVLALAALSAPIRKLYADEKIDRETIRALTLATPAQQADWLKLWSSGGNAPTGRDCRAWVTGGAAISTERALFDLAGYPGAVTADLFGGGAVFADAGAFWDAQNAAMAEKIESYRQRGWKDVVLLERGAMFRCWEYVRMTRKQGGKVIVEQRHNGAVSFHEGWLTTSEARRAKAASSAGGEAANKTVRPEMSGPMADYISLHRHGAAQASLIRHPAIALRLMVAHALCSSVLWAVGPHTPGAVKEVTLASLAGGSAAAELKTARDNIEALFEAQNAPAPRRSAGAYHLCEVFAALLALSDPEVMQVMAVAMAETLESGGPAVEAVLHACGTDLSVYWRPDQAFFDLLRDKPVINALLASIGGPALAESCAADTARAQKTVLANRIAGEGCAPHPNWCPGWMQVPPARHVDGAASGPADAWDRIAGLFETDTEESSGTGADASDVPAA